MSLIASSLVEPQATYRGLPRIKTVTSLWRFDAVLCCLFRVPISLTYLGECLSNRKDDFGGIAGAKIPVLSSPHHLPSKSLDIFVFLLSPITPVA